MKFTWREDPIENKFQWLIEIDGLELGDAKTQLDAQDLFEVNQASKSPFVADTIFALWIIIRKLEELERGRQMDGPQAFLETKPSQSCYPHPHAPYKAPE